jgi:NADPH-dependent curcumin reductase CurA
MKINQIVLASRPVGKPTAENFRTEEVELNEPGADSVLLKPLFISVDPYMRGRMNDAKSYVPPFQVDKPIDGGVVATVVESKSGLLRAGDTVVGNLPWATQCIEKADKLRKVDIRSIPAGYYLGVLGMPGLTAYVGLVEIAKPLAGETVVVSGAAGAVGIIVGQIAKVYGCRVIGIAGTDEKCRMLKDEFGFDGAVNYKTSQNLKQDIGVLCPKGVDIYFDNVGGDISDAVIANINFHARIALCGQIALYNSTSLPVGPRLLPMLLTRSVMVQGFINGDYKPILPEAYKNLTAWIGDGKIKYKQTIVHGFDKLPEAFLGLFSGANEGKMLVEMG